MTVQDEVPLHLNYSWSNKYTPIKPKYINRVRTGIVGAYIFLITCICMCVYIYMYICVYIIGYYWNRYNLTHYTQENPPPKLVQGYKFTIFYPDIIDPTISPKYTLGASDDPEFAIIKFRAGNAYTICIYMSLIII